MIKQVDFGDTQHSMAVLYSALQKGVRWNKPELAVPAAAAIYRSGFGNAVFKRLKVVCVEDIGLASIDATAHVARYQSDFRLKLAAKQETSLSKVKVSKCYEVMPEGEKPMLKLVRELCAAPKSRLQPLVSVLGLARALLKLRRDQLKSALASSLAAQLARITTPKLKRAIELVSERVYEPLLDTGKYSDEWMRRSDSADVRRIHELLKGERLASMVGILVESGYASHRRFETYSIVPQNASQPVTFPDLEKEYPDVFDKHTGSSQKKGMEHFLTRCIAARPQAADQELRHALTEALQPSCDAYRAFDRAGTPRTAKILAKYTKSKQSSGKKSDSPTTTTSTTMTTTGNRSVGKKRRTRKVLPSPGPEFCFAQLPTTPFSGPFTYMDRNRLLWLKGPMTKDNPEGVNDLKLDRLLIALEKKRTGTRMRSRGLVYTTARESYNYVRDMSCFGDPDKDSFLAADDLSKGQYTVKSRSSKVWHDVPVAEFNEQSPVTGYSSRDIGKPISFFEALFEAAAFKWCLGIRDLANRNVMMTTSDPYFAYPIDGSLRNVEFKSPTLFKTAQTAAIRTRFNAMLADKPSRLRIAKRISEWQEALVFVEPKTKHMDNKERQEFLRRSTEIMTALRKSVRLPFSI